MTTRDWSLQNCLAKCSPPRTSSYVAIKAAKVKLKKEEITYSDIARAYQLLAKIVNEYGEKYLPLFERLHHEIKNTKLKRIFCNLPDRWLVKGYPQLSRWPVTHDFFTHFLTQFSHTEHW